ncbi:MAG: hypothetical protein MJ088_03405 [Clostridia bacterium]|nr:hypothetical protein [Clostridia bacterium]
MKLSGKAIIRFLLSIFFIGWGAVSVGLFVLALPGVSVYQIVSAVLGLLLVVIGVMAIIHKAVPLCRLFCVIVFVLAALAFLVSAVMRIFSAGTAISFGSLLTAFLAALELTLL